MTAVESLERTDVVTFRGTPMTLVGRTLEIGDHAPEFSLIPAANTSATVTLADTLHQFTRAALLIIVPSIDTSVCALETVRFNREVANVPSDKLGVYTISVDLPYAQKRWSAAENINSIELLSDYKTRLFGPSYGVLIKELALYARSIFLIDKVGIIRYIEIVAETAREPDYQAVLEAATTMIA
jgi:thioredoxin-dependent peroxiredoxin